MKFVIQGLKYDTDKMKKIANVKKWYETNTEDYNKKVGNAITEEEAKSLLMRYTPDIYETEFEKIPEA